MTAALFPLEKGTELFLRENDDDEKEELEKEWCRSDEEEEELTKGLAMVPRVNNAIGWILEKRRKRNEVKTKNTER